MSALLEKIDDLNGLILQGRPLDAFEKYYTQVSVQEWKDGKIIKEQFFYAA